MMATLRSISRGCPPQPSAESVVGHSSHDDPDSTYRSLKALHASHTRGGASDSPNVPAHCVQPPACTEQASQLAGHVYGVVVFVLVDELLDVEVFVVLEVSVVLLDVVLFDVLLLLLDVELVVEVELTVVLLDVELFVEVDVSVVLLDVVLFVEVLLFEEVLVFDELVLTLDVDVLDELLVLVDVVMSVHAPPRSTFFPIDAEHSHPPAPLLAASVSQVKPLLMQCA